MQSVRLLSTAVAATTILALSGCAALTDDSDTGSDGGRSTPSIAVGLYPLEYVAARVAGDAFDVESLTTPGAEPHDLTLGVRETALVADADLLVYVGSLQPDVDAAATEVAEGQVLDAADVVDLLPFAEEGHDHEGEDAHAEDEHAEDEHAEDEHAEDDHAEDDHAEDDHAEDDHAEDDHADEEHADEEHADEEHDHVHGEEHDHGEYDPHFWQDPLRMALLGDAIAGRLGEIDPRQKDAFEANAAELRADLEELDQAYATGLADCAITTVVTTHHAFGYLEKYGVHLEAITGITPDAEPTPAGLADLQDLIESDGITTVFSESLVSPKNAQTLARDAGVGTEVLDTVEGLSDETADEDYLSLMRQNLTKLQEANRC